MLRAGSVFELWRRHPMRKEFGPLRSVYRGSGTRFVARFLDDKGHFMLAATEAIRIYQVGNRAYLDSYEFGHDSTLSGTTLPSYTFSDATNDGKTVLYADATGTGGPLVLDPALWRRKLCGIIGHRDFTAEERGGLPVRVPAGPVCQ